MKMKTRIFIPFLLLVLFVLCSLILAQEDPRTPLEKARDARDEAETAYLVAKDDADDAYKKYNQADKTRMALSNALALAEYKGDDNGEDLLWGNLFNALDHIQLDLLDFVSDAAKDIIQG